MTYFSYKLLKSTIIPEDHLANAEYMSENSVFVHIAQTMRKEMIERGFDKFEDNPTLSLATMVDPCTKYVGLEDPLKREKAAQLLMDEARKIQIEIVANGSSASESSLTVASACNSGDTFWEEFDARSAQINSQTSNRTSDDEVRAFLAVPNIHRDHDPLLW